jgi:putative membrane protein
MKKFTFTIFAALSVLITACSGEQDSVKQAHEQNLNSSIDKDISKFLTEAADARMMNIEQGKLAQQNGTTPTIKEYGQLLVTEQTRILTDLRVLAASKNIMLPNSLSKKNVNGLENLNEKSGVEFDDEFIDMIKADHKRDVDEFEDATDFADKDVTKFAAMYLPVIESHLDKIREVDDKQ